MPRRDGTLDVLDRWLLVAGVLLLATYGGSLLYRTVGSHLALSQFDRVLQAGSGKTATLEEPEQEDFSLWSGERVRAYRQTRVQPHGSLLAVVALPRLDIRAPVFAGTDEFALNRGVGWIEGTARPGEKGNVGIAGHRDGFFRGLKDVQIGDAVEVTTSRGRLVYTVADIEIVSPENTGVLLPRGRPSVTLVTCYPFYFVGSAPKRFIVHAALSDLGARQKGRDQGERK